MKKTSKKGENPLWYILLRTVDRVNPTHATEIRTSFKSSSAFGAVAYVVQSRNIDPDCVTFLEVRK